MEKLKWFSYFLLLAAAHGLLLIAILKKIPNKNKRANINLSVMIGLIVTALIGRLAFDPVLFKHFPHFVIIADIIIFLFGPCFYFYIRSVMGLPPVASKYRWLHFLPAFAHFASMLPQIIISKETYIHMMMVEKTPWLYAVWLIFEGLALALNFGYLYASYRVVQKHKKNPLMKPYQGYINTLLILMVICLTGWLQGYVLYFFGVKNMLSFIGSNLAWLIPTGITYYLGYLMAVNPKLFQVPATTKVKYQNSSLGKSDIEKTKDKIEEFMTNHKPYVQANITLSSLAQMLEIKPANLSRIINECYQKNFFDFINTYRVQHFIELAPLTEHKHKTLLGVALEVGFNSKSTFNRAFKKELQMTPTAYFKQANMLAN